VAPSRPGELPTGIAILGLLIERPDTIAGLGVRLREEHPGGQWPRNSAHTSVPALAENGLVRVARRGRERSLDLYETTSGGVEHFRAWLRSSAAVVPARRDALRAKLKYVEREEHLRAILGEMRRQEQLCRREAEAAVTRYATARQLSLAGEEGAARWRSKVQRALMVDEANLWYERTRGLKRLRQQLEGALDT
jgi:DNA-binding PadR family transcriptional regulator